MNNFEIKSDTKILTLSCTFLIFKTKNSLNLFSEVGSCFFLILCYQTRHLQQIHRNKIFYRMYGLAVMLSVANPNYSVKLASCE